jgi:hypothetical protein
MRMRLRPPRAVRLAGGLVLLAAAAWGQEGGPDRAAPGAAAAQADLVAAAFNVTSDVEELRGLRFASRVPVQAVSDSVARAQFMHRAARFWPEAQVRAEQQAYAQLGLLPAGTDLQGVLLDILEEQAGGYYDPEQGTFFVLADMPAALAPMILVHELTHALDDQHFDLDAMLERVRDESDRSLAVGAVIEGSGTLVMSIHMLREMQAGRLDAEAVTSYQESEMGRAERLLASPPLLQRLLLAPYVLGQNFLLRGEATRLLTGLDPEDLNRAFRDPPASSEQILHAEKYWDEARRDVPRPMPLADESARLGPGWSLQGQGDLGELLIAMLAGADMPDVNSIAVTQPESWTNAAASGWGGDRWHLYGDGTRHVTVLVTRWDDAAEAREFESALVPRDGLRVWRQDDAVVLVAGDAGRHAEALARAHLRGPAAAGR